MRIDKERMIIETLQVIKRMLTRSQVTKMERKNPFRQPTKKELDKHPKLIRKQRRLSMGDV